MDLERLDDMDSDLNLDLILDLEESLEKKDKMEVLHLVKSSSSLSVPPQDVPVDLTTGGKICHTSLLERLKQNGRNFEFPHLRFHHSNINRNLIKESDDSKALCSEITTNESFEKENKYMSQIPEKANSPVRQIRDTKKRSYEDYADYKTPPSKKQKLVADEVSITDANFSAVSKSIQRFSNDLETSKDLKSPYYTLANVSDPSIPSIGGLMEHAGVLERLKHSQSIDASPTSIKETESLLAAVQHSQMLYYSYCTKLLQNLHTRRFLQEQEHIRKTFGNGYHTDIISITPTERKKETTSEREVNSTSSGENLSQTSKSPKQDGSSSPTSSCSSLFKSSSSSSLCSSSSATSGCSPLSPSQPSSTTEVEDRGTSPSLDSSETPGKKRAPRALTGKHVRPGTGASPTTLLTLRQKLMERQKFREEKAQLEKHLTKELADDGCPMAKRR